MPPDQRRPAVTPHLGRPVNAAAPPTATHTPIDHARRAPPPAEARQTPVARVPIAGTIATSTHAPLSVGRRVATQRPPVVVSMTTIPERVGRIEPTIRSILGQVPPPDEVRLYVGFDCPPVAGVTLLRVEDRGPVTKLSAVLDPEVSDHAVVVTADDDVEYQQGWLSTLVDAAVATPECAIGYSGWNVSAFLSDAPNASYVWPRTPAMCDVVEGWAGAAYRKRFFDGDATSPPEEFRTVDDVWISGVLRRRGIPRRLVGPRLARSRDVTPGLHKQAGFLERNRAAARALFGAAPPSQRSDDDPKLTICISSIPARWETLQQLVNALRAQPRFDEVELLIAVDDRRVPVHLKRTRLTQAAVGQYICHFDDDDLPAPTYVPDILKAIDENPGVDAVAIRGIRTADGTAPVLFDYRVGGVEGETANGVVWHTPCHLCPIRSEIAKAVPFPPISVGEDIYWIPLVRPLIKTCARAGAPGKVLYHYRFDPRKAKMKLQDRPAARQPVFNRPPTAGAAGAPASTPSPSTPASPAASPTPLAGAHEAAFTPQYVERSGLGSTLDFTEPYREFLSRFVEERGVVSVLDLGCGDMTVMKNTDLRGARYRGVDVVRERLSRNRAICPGWDFEHRDVHAWTPDAADLIVVKDVLQHWSTADVKEWLARLAGARFRFALLTNCNYGPTVNSDIKTGAWRALDLTAPPFGLGEVVFSWTVGEIRKDVVLVRGPLADGPPVELAPRAAPRKLELGCGAAPADGYLHHDVRAHSPHVDVAHDLNETPWPWADGAFDEVLSNDVFEHLRVDVADWMDECWRVLAAGGVLKLRVPHWQSADMWTDPTHRRWFGEQTFDYWDPEKPLHRHGSVYFGERGRWWSVSARRVGGNVEATLRKRG